MQTPAVASEFLELVARSGLISARRMESICQQLAITPELEAERVARRLVRSRILTPFQAERLLEGRYRGLLIDRYPIREVLGFGGMGCVFIAEDPKLKRKVAIKLLAAEHALDAGMLTRLKLEAAAGMKLNHPNVVRTLRLGSTGAVHFLVMELFRGITMHELVALHGPVRWETVCDFGLQAAQALTTAHKQHIIHRDLKPANFLIDGSGVLKILDFGLALMKDQPEEEFSLSMLFGHDCLGTPDYIAPEQTTNSQHVDARADIYSLGASLYVALTARVPFSEKSNKAKLEAHRVKQPRGVREIRPDIPQNVADIIARMMEKDPDKRFASAEEVVAAFQPLAKRNTLNFDFRELVTLRAKQARARIEKSSRSTVSGPRSSITSPSGWLGANSRHLQESTATFARSETPAVREPARPPSRSQPASAPPAATRKKQRKAAPPGWRLESLNDQRVFPITVSEVSVGSASKADIVLPKSSADSIQCWIEYDGTGWRFRQESKSVVSLVNGSAEAYAELQHGSRIKFLDGSGVRLVNIAAQAASRRRRRFAIISGIVLVLVTVVIAVVMSQL
jgi:eukaryotic-like serine/threonine-protein kinase